MKACNECGAAFEQDKRQRGTCLPCRRKYFAEWRAKSKLKSGVREHLSNYQRQYVKTEKGQSRLKAKGLLRNAVRRGELVKQPCEKCGDKAQAHHPDYSKPLEVQWLCREHHMEAHGKGVLVSKQEPK